MKSNVIRGIVAGVATVMMIASIAICGRTNDTGVDIVVKAANEEDVEVKQIQDVGIMSPEEETMSPEGEMMSLEEEIEAVQNTWIFMGGLRTTDDSDKVIEVAMFRNEDGNIVYIYEEDGNLDYGTYTTAYAKTDDGKDYAEIDGSIGKYGYYFNEDIVSGIIVDTNGNVYEAKELDEAGARAYVSRQLEAESWLRGFMAA